MPAELGKIILPPTPKPARDDAEFRRNVETWTRQAERAIRQFETAVQDLLARVSTLEGGQ